MVLDDDHVGLRAELGRLITSQPDPQLVAKAAGARESGAPRAESGADARSGEDLSLPQVTAVRSQRSSCGSAQTFACSNSSGAGAAAYANAQLRSQVMPSID